MAAWITYMEVNMNSEGVTPTELTNTLRQYGWKPVWGRYDYGYKWDANWWDEGHNINEYFAHINKIHEILRGRNVSYSLCTCEQGKENFWVKWSE